MTRPTITIIGGGACGVAAFIELILKFKTISYQGRVQINIIESRKEIGQGLAFGTNQPGHILNTQADLMGIFAFEPAHYSDWLQKNENEKLQEIKGAEEMKEAHSTRRLYGHYLQEQFQNFCKIGLAAEYEINLINDEAENITRNNDQWQVWNRSGSRILTDYIILAPGTPKPNNYADLEHTPGYIDFPWPSDPILQIPKQAAIGILGSSLSAIDTIMTLADNQHKGKITLFSPDGLLPRVQPQEDSEYERQYLTLENIHKIKRKNLRPPKVKELFDLFKKEVENFTKKSINWEETGRMGKPAHDLLLQDIALAEAGGDAFINILYSLRPDASTIWGWLSVEEKLKFMRWLGLYWNINRHAMPLTNAYRLKKIFNAGQLKVQPELKEVKFDAETKRFRLRCAENGYDEVSYLINATGPANKIEQMRSTLIQNLNEQGLIEAYKAGGILVKPHNMQLISSKAETKNIYAAGHICNGILLDVNAVWFNVQTIEKMCGDIIQKITSGARS